MRKAEIRTTRKSKVEHTERGTLGAGDREVLFIIAGQFFHPRRHCAFFLQILRF